MHAIVRPSIVFVACFFFNALLFGQSTTTETRKRTSTTDTKAKSDDKDQKFLAFNFYKDGGDAYSRGDYEKGLRLYQLATRIDPSNPQYINAVAWSQATCAEANLRNPILAIESMRIVCRDTEYKKADYLDTFAAALAAFHDFPDAVKFQQKAYEIAKQDPKYPQETLIEIRRRIDLYKQRLPYYEVPKIAILAKYQDVVRAKLSTSSLARITDQQKKELIEFLREVPKVWYLEIDEATVIQDYDYVLLMLTSGAMHDDYIADFARKLPTMKPDSKQRLRDILLDEREQIDAPRPTVRIPKVSKQAPTSLHAVKQDQ